MLATFLSGEAATRYGAAPVSERQAAVLTDLATLLGQEVRSGVRENQKGNCQANPRVSGAY